MLKKLMGCPITVFAVSIMLSAQALAQSGKLDDGKAPVASPTTDRGLITPPKTEQSPPQPREAAKGVKNFILLPKPGAGQTEQKKDTAPKPPQPPNCPEKVEGVENAGQFDFQMGDWIQVCVVGLNPQELAKTASLYFNGLKIPAITTREAAQDPEGRNVLYLSFHLTRDSLTTTSREAWDAYLRTKQGIQSPITLSVSLGNDNLPPQYVLSPAEARFSVANRALIHTTVWVGIAIFLVVYFVLVRHNSILRDSENGTYSLGKSQLAFWALIVLIAFIGVYLINGSMEAVPVQVLGLFGISAGTTLGAILVDTNKASANHRRIEDLQKDIARFQEDQAKTGANASATFKQLIEQKNVEIQTLQQTKRTSKGFWRDICDDGDGVSFHRLQIVLWTLTLGAVFVHYVSEIMSMPTFPEGLLALMGISSATYLTVKGAAEKPSK